MTIVNPTIENYLKCIYALSTTTEGGISTTSIADRLKTKASSVTDMLKRLSEKGLVHYKKYHGASLTKDGSSIALRTLRKHRLWEVFLVKELDFEWNEVHDIAEQLEHIRSEELTERLDAFLGHPQFDPHGDPIPDTNGRMNDDRQTAPLSGMRIGSKSMVVGVKDSSARYLVHLDGLGIGLGTHITALGRSDFDSTLQVEIDEKTIHLSPQTAANLIMKL